MHSIAAEFKKLKTSVGGNREKYGYEETFGMPREEEFHVAGPSRANIRILGELEFALKMSEEEGGAWDGAIKQALDFLLGRMEAQGVLTNQDCLEAEELLAPLEAEAKSYHLILASHAHIDMNWMWSYDETVAIVLATFRSVLNVMEQYPGFCFSQSQGAVYRIVEEYDPDMMEEIKARIREGRWEVTAAAWVETDKNMPSGESLLRHIRHTKEYMQKVWGVDRLEVDFSPDTFGHSANVPEINRFGEVKYYYHCRGNAREDILYRYRGLSGQEVLAYREPNWYNGAITPHMASGLPKISRLSGGLRTGLVVYGVGDHGGGPTRRDVERALDMMAWRIYPEIRFGTLHEYFHEAEKIWDQLPVVDEELNYFAPGCYTTQSRIKRGNRRMECALLDAETLSAMAGKLAGYPYAKEQLEKAWENVLFTHFHDILTGSCVRESREYAMGLFQTSSAAANTQIQNAMRRISLAIDTSSIAVDMDSYNSQSEGAGAGYGLENFSGVPGTERGSGRTRIFHIFNTLSFARSENVELTVWDWTGDLRLMKLTDFRGKEIPFQLLDKKLQTYWDHKYVRLLVSVTVPALGYTTAVLSEEEPKSYPVYLKDRDHIAGVFDDFVLENEKLRVRISSDSGRIASLYDKENSRELIREGESAGFTFLETEKATSSAWEIGRHEKSFPVDRCICLSREGDGPLRQSVKASYTVAGSKLDVVYSLDKGADVVKLETTADWHEVGSDTVPVLDYRIPLAYEASRYLYDIPAGAVAREARHNDVPGLRYGLALGQGESCAVLISDSKYGYRGADGTLALTLINSSTSPDPYPERGIHHITLWLGSMEGKAAKAEKLAERCCRKLFYQPSNAHRGTLPMEGSLFAARSGHTVISAVLPGEDGTLIVRAYETEGRKDSVCLSFGTKVDRAEKVNLFEHAARGEAHADGCQVEFDVEPWSLAEVKVYLE